MRKRFLLFPAVFAALAAAQTVPLTQNSVTNHDIVTLAKAGFNEDFIVDFISSSRTRFDVSVAGLADMAKEGLSERLIRAMLAAGSPQQAVPLQASGAMMQMGEAPTPIRARKMSEPAMAMSAQTPYYQTSSFLWGLIRKQVRINVGPQAERSPFPQLGTAFGQVRIAAPVAMGTHYVVIP